MNTKNIKAACMLNFISVCKKDLSLVIDLLEVKRGVKRLKGEEFSVVHESSQFPDVVLKECIQVLKEFLKDPDPGVDYIERFNEKGQIVIDLLQNLKNQTNVFKNPMMEILLDLEKATTKFKLTAK